MKQEEEQKMTSEKYREGFIHFFYISPFITSIVLSLRYICLSILCAHHNTTTIDNDNSGNTDHDNNDNNNDDDNNDDDNEMIMR